ncbi:CLUMA_CG008389, isoform A [Clunio marinus]|uniref:CLUMA_CG008389, isoform A n=1 Tax=Clunio marinus TaxID=568069 RepID=A0A1J1I8Z3_9DIPT|nr:CLUMA_CG008389, isoform A [Clunio marinus]
MLSDSPLCYRFIFAQGNSIYFASLKDCNMKVYRPLLNLVEKKSSKPLDFPLSSLFTCYNLRRKP